MKRILTPRNFTVTLTDEDEIISLMVGVSKIGKTAKEDIKGYWRVLHAADGTAGGFVKLSKLRIHHHMSQKHLMISDIVY